MAANGVVIKQERLEAVVSSGPALFARRHWPRLQALADGLLWFLAVPFTTWLRYDFAFDRATTAAPWIIGAFAGAAQVLLGWAAGLYRRRWKYGSFSEVKILALVAVAVTFSAFALVEIASTGADVPRSVPFLAGGTALIAMAGVRYMYRLVSEVSRRPADAEPIVVLGAGEAGDQAVRQLLTSRQSPFFPVAFLDDDPAKRQLRLHGVRVHGTREDMASVAGHYRARKLLVAIPSAGSEFLRRVREQAEAADVDLLVLPPVSELYNGITVADIRPVTEEDLLGRHPAEIDIDAIAHLVAGKRVLVTGAGGSIGSELCRQLHTYAPAQLLMLDRDESLLHGTQLSIEGRALLTSPDLLLADIRDAARLRRLFEQHRPEVVFHAAALKHLPLLEAAPEEAWQTNVEGTQNVLDAARAVGVERFVNISTDKAANPESVLGFSKRITERLTAQAAVETGRSYVSVRFGNVLGSRGSMLGTFQAQLAAGGPITVTHRDITRYFMTVQEAVRLTIQAAAIGAPGEVLVLDMGEPVRIADVARRLAEQSPRPVNIVYTGLRDGEKLHEDLLGADEADVRPHHPLISHAPVPPVSIEQVRDVCCVAEGLVPNKGCLAQAAGLDLERAGAPADDDDLTTAAD